MINLCSEVWVTSTANPRLVIHTPYSTDDMSEELAETLMDSNDSGKMGIS